MWAIQAWHPLKFLLIPAPVKQSRVNAAAVRLFKVGADRRTHGRTGVLLYLSMREHRAEIVADEAIAGKVDAEVWGKAMADMLAEIRQGRIAEGLAAGVRGRRRSARRALPARRGRRERTARPTDRGVDFSLSCTPLKCEHLVNIESAEKNHAPNAIVSP